MEGFVQRDMYKPNTDIQMGTLPPKLARMMVNFTAQNSGILWDPFCGSGTIPMEAVILGFNTLASDVNPVAVNTTSSNIEWLSKEGFAPDALYESFRFDVTKANKEVIKKLKNTDITVKNSKIEAIGKTSEKGIDCSDMLVFPGLVDMHSHFREPGE